MNSWLRGERSRWCVGGLLWRGLKKDRASIRETVSVCVLWFCTYTVGIQPILFIWKSMYQGAEQQLIFTEMALYPISPTECKQKIKTATFLRHKSHRRVSFKASEQMSSSVLDYSEEAPSAVLMGIVLMKLNHCFVPFDCFLLCAWSFKKKAFLLVLNKTFFLPLFKESFKLWFKLKVVLYVSI